jgi:hypothetical protein
MEPEIKTKLDALEQKTDAIFKSVEKTRKYFLIIMWITVVAVVLPVIGLLFAIPSFLSSYADLLSM